MNVYRLSPEADEDLIAIWLFVSKDNVEAADRLLSEIVKCCEMLAEYPEAGRERSELAPRLRSFPVRRYILFYRPTREGVEIARVLHGARDIESIFGV